MAAPTAAEQKAFAQGLNLNDRLKVIWIVPGIENERITWYGVVKAADNAQGIAVGILYEGQGDTIFTFPPDSSEAKILGLEKLTDERPKMNAIHAMSSITTLNPVDLSTWRPYMKDRITAGLLMDKLKMRFGMIPVPNLRNKWDADRARQTHYFEKETLIDVLETWLTDKVGNAAYDQPPHNGVALMVIRRFHCFDINEKKGGSIQQYMDNARSTNDPRQLMENEKAALKKSSKNEF